MLIPGSAASDSGDNSVAVKADGCALLTDARGEPRIADGDGNGSVIVDLGAAEISSNVVLFLCLNDSNIDTLTTSGLIEINDQTLQPLVAGGVYFYNGSPITQFDPGALGAGVYTISYQVSGSGGTTLSGVFSVTVRDPVIVTTHLDVSNSSDGLISLREALEIVRLDPTREAVAFNIDPALGTDFDALTQTIYLQGLQLEVESEVFVYAPKSTGVILDARIDPTQFQAFDRVMEVMMNGEVTIENVTFQYGYSYGSGGGIQNLGSLDLTNCHFLSNEASSENGGGINNEGALDLQYCSFKRNLARDGGGVYNKTSERAVIYGCTFSQNSAFLDGGGVRNALSNEISIANCTFYHNEADTGGGMSNWGTTSVEVIQSSFSRNSANRGGGIFQESSSMSLCHTIIANSQGDDVVDFGNSLTLDGANWVEDGTVPGALTGDPQLLPLADNGGLVETCALAFGSPAIDAGDNTKLPNFDCSLEFDARLFSRIYDGDNDSSAVVDLGAFESKPCDYPPVICLTRRQADGSHLIEFEVFVPDVDCIVQYSHDLKTWSDTVPVISVSSPSIQQWVDDGTQTVSAPSVTAKRFYRILQISPE